MNGPIGIFHASKSKPNLTPIQRSAFRASPWFCRKPPLIFHRTSQYCAIQLLESHFISRALFAGDDFPARKGPASMPSLSSVLLRPLLPAAVVLACLVAATQWTAALLAYQPALGTPWLDLVGLKLYAPWKLFFWWLAFGAQAPDVFARTGTLAALGGVAAGFVAIGGAAWRAGQGPTPRPMARPAGRTQPTSGGWPLGGKGIVLGVYDGRYLRHDGPEHVLAVAPTRSGKGVGLVVPTLSPGPAPPSSTTSRARTGSSRLGGGRSSRIACSSIPPTRSRARFNPLLEVRRGLNEVRDVQNIADILIDPEGARPARPLGEDGPFAADRRHPARALRRARQDARPRRHRSSPIPSRSIRRTLWVMVTTNHLGTDAGPWCTRWWPERARAPQQVG